MDSVRHPTARRWSEMSPFIGCWSINQSLMPQPGTEYQYSSVTGTSPQLASALLLPSKTGNFRYLRASVPVLRRTLPATRRHVNVSTCSLLRRYGGFRLEQNMHNQKPFQPGCKPNALDLARARIGFSKAVGLYGHVYFAAGRDRWDAGADSAQLRRCHS